MKACHWCGARSDTRAPGFSPLSPDRCPECRAPWPGLGQPIGLHQESAAEILRGQLAAFDDPDTAADAAFVEITRRMGLVKCYHGKPSCQQDANHKGHHDDGSHRWSLRVNGSRSCRDCNVTEYDSQWGAGLFNDWPRGTSKPYGS